METNIERNINIKKYFTHDITKIIYKVIKIRQNYYIKWYQHKLSLKKWRILKEERKDKYFPFNRHINHYKALLLPDNYDDENSQENK